MELIDERVERPLVALAAARHELAAALPRREHGERHDTDEQREPASVLELRQVRREEQPVDGQEGASSGRNQPERLAPLVANDVEEEQRGDRDRPGHRHAVRVGQRRRCLERDDEGQHRDQKRPVDPRDVDLADRSFGGVRDSHPWEVAELGGLLHDRERAGDHRLRGDHRRRGGQEHHRELSPARDEQEERAADAFCRVAEDQGALPQVAQDAGGKHEDQPDARDRRAAEVPHVRVEGLGSRDGEDDGGQGEERDREVPEDEAEGVRR